MDTLTTRQVELPGRTVELATPAAPEALLDAAAAAGAATPYWIDVWPCALRLAAWLDGQELAGRRVLELGCGLGLPSLVAALRGAEVLATDVEPDALACTLPAPSGWACRWPSSRPTTATHLPSC